MDVDEKDDSSSSDEEEEINVDVKALKRGVEYAPRSYDAHAAYVQGLRKVHDFTELRKARQAMSKLFPLPLSLWKEWLEDEQRLATDQKSRLAVLDLFHKACEDYEHVEVYLAACAHAQECYSGFSAAEVKGVRAEFERATTAMGLHITQGAQIWGAYRAYEEKVLDDVLEEHGLKSEAAKQQMDVLDKIYVRQLSVPLQGNEDTYKKYKDFRAMRRLHKLSDKVLKKGKEVDPSVTRRYQIALQKARDRQDFEQKVADSAVESSPETLGMGSEAQRASWSEYITYEIKQSAKEDPSQVQVLFERWVSVHFLVADVWQRYLDFLDQHLRAPDLMLRVSRRAVRNCAWNLSFWEHLFAACNAAGVAAEQVREFFAEGLQTEFGSISTKVMMCLQAVHCYRRAAQKSVVPGTALAADALARIDTVMTKASKLLAKLPAPPSTNTMHTLYFEPTPSAADDMQDGSLHFVVYTLWAHLHGILGSNPEQGRTHLKALCDILPYHIPVYLASVQYEVTLKEWSKASAHYKRLFNKIPLSWDWVLELIGRRWVLFEEQYGTLDSVREAKRRCNDRYAQLNARRVKNAAKAEEKANKPAANAKRKRKKPEAAATKASATSKRKRTREAASSSAPPPQQPPAVPTSFSSPPPPPASATAGSSANTESTAAPSSSSDGPTAPNPKRLKTAAAGGAFAFGTPPPPPQMASSSSSSQSQPATSSSSAAPMEEEEEEEEERKEKKPSPQAEDAELAARTAFVLNTPFDITQDRVNEIFQRFGKIDAVRVPRKANGRGKGFCYVEFASPESVAAAITASAANEITEGRRVLSVQQYKSIKPSDKGSQQHTVFVQNLPKSGVNLDTALREAFGKCGQVVDVRLGRTHNGDLKGFAYVQLNSEEAVTEALKLSGKPLPGSGGTGRPRTAAMKVKKYLTKEQQQAERKRKAMQKVARLPTRKPSRVGRLAMVPRTLVRGKDSAKKGGTGKGGSSGAPKSNADFRALLLGNKKKE